ncbi:MULTISPECIES: hypothetical protein [Streptomyces]|uniref:Uncharacterized protein n=1 Tax=Streptomyces sp. NBC_00093 TaxID=2975649 RepID=A0AAU2A3U7_9ACTN
MANHTASTAVRPTATTAVRGNRGTGTGDRGARVPVLMIAAQPRKLNRNDFVLVN